MFAVKNRIRDIYMYISSISLVIFVEFDLYPYV